MTVERELREAIGQLREEKEEGFNTIYAGTYDFVYKRAFYIMKNQQDAMDLLQEVYVQVYRNIGALQDDNNLYGWLGAITYNQGMRIFRKQKELLVDEEEEIIFANEESTEEDWSPEDSAEKQALCTIMSEIIEELPELQRAALTAFYCDEMSINQIAEAFECSPNTIKSRLNYARKYVKDRVLEREEREGYRLHSFGAALFIPALWGIFSQESYAAPANAAAGLYGSICKSVGIEAAKVKVAAAGAKAGATIGKSLIAKITAGIVAVATTVTIGVIAISGNQGPDTLEEYQEYEGVYYSEGMDYDSFMEIITTHDVDLEQAIAIKIKEVTESDGRIFAQVEISQEMRFDETVPQFVREEKGESFGGAFRGGGTLVEGRVEIPWDLELKLNEDGTVTANWHVSMEMSDGTIWEKDMPTLTLYKAGGPDEICPGWD